MGIAVSSVFLALVAPLFVIIGTLLEFSFEHVCWFAAGGSAFVALLVHAVGRFLSLKKREMPLVATVGYGLVAAVFLMFAADVSRHGVSGFLGACLLVTLVSIVAGFVQMSVTTEVVGDLNFAKAGVLSMMQITLTCLICRLAVSHAASEFLDQVCYVACMLLVVCALTWISESFEDAKR